MVGFTIISPIKSTINNAISEITIIVLPTTLVVITSIPVVDAKINS